MNPELSSEEALKEISLKQERSIADQVALIKVSEPDLEIIESRIVELLISKPKITLELFKESWRKYIKEQLKLKRTLADIFKSVVDLDLSDRQGLGPDVPSEEMYDRLNKAMVKIKGDSPGAVATIIRGVVMEFRPERISK